MTNMVTRKSKAAVTSRQTVNQRRKVSRQQKEKEAFQAVSKASTFMSGDGKTLLDLYINNGDGQLGQYEGKSTRIKKRNKQDATLININAIKKEIATIHRILKTHDERLQSLFRLIQLR